MLGDPAFTPALLMALLTFVTAGSITPGPNNIMLMVSGVNFGMRRTLPQAAGVFTGVILIDSAVCLGLGFVFSEFPLVRITLMVLGVAYTLWLSWKIATAGSLGGGEMAHPLSFPAALAFQWINPKLWMVGISAAALYVHPGHAVADTIIIVGTLSAINIPCMAFWAGCGAALRETLQIPSRIRAFNIVMGLLLATSVLAVLRV